MENHLENLGAFFHGSDELVALSAEDKKVLEAYAEAIRDDKELEDRTLCAFIVFNGNCGFANSGSQAYVQNRRADRSVKATIRVNWTQGIDSGSYQATRTIPAGGRQYLGCTKSGAIPVASYSFQVIGCQVL